MPGWILLPLVSLVLFVPGALLVLHLASLVEDSLGGDLASRGLADRLFPFAETDAAWSYLPEAPGGWLRATPDDAVPGDVQRAIDHVATRWPGGEAQLRTHLGFQSLGRYLDQHGRPATLLNPRSPRNQGQVLFLHPDGTILSMGITLLPTDRALGPDDAPQAWQAEALRRGEAARWRVDAVHELSVAGFPAISFARSLIANVPPAPFDDRSRTPVRLDLVVVLDARAYITFRGLATPSQARALLAATDIRGIRARVAPADNRSFSLSHLFE